MHSTSLDALESILDSAPTQRLRVWREIEHRKHYGATDEELQIALKMNPNTERPRRQELQKMYMVKHSGRTRPTSSGRQAIVWIDYNLERED